TETDTETETETDAGAAPAPPDVEAPAPPGAAGGADVTGADDPAAVAVAEGGAADAAEPELPSILRMAMRRGFTASLDGEITDDGRRFYRTVRGGYVRASRLRGRTPSDHRGVALGATWELPLGFVWRSGTRRLRRRGDRFLNAGPLERLTLVDIAETVQRGRRSYVVDPEGFAANRRSVRVATPQARPEGVAADERWVHVSLAEQTLVAYEGDRPVYATSVSTGREGFETPVGTFRVQSKHVSTTMDDLMSADPYQIEDVPWTLYFEGNYALHGAFWHGGFGRVRSHGCVNLAPADARWLFHWAGPELPPGWHGVFASRGRPGTVVHVTE
ncbi:MAG: L,D-transpeptidase, partial [Myxococcota bacterium]